MLTTEEQERAAYAAGNAALTDALGRVLDLEAENDRLWALISEVLEGATDADGVIDADWRERAAAALED